MITERPVQGRSPGLRRAAPRTAEASASGRDTAAVIRAYVSLTKPRIVELLLVTTVPAMMVAAGGWPDLGLVLVVLVGGSLAAGAASALNCYIDRDIDELMRRTKRRPLPAHSVTPRAVLIFGLTLAAGAASALYCYIDRDSDQLMRRTNRRPLPAHSVTPRAVLIFGFTLAAISLVLMGAFTNWLATALTAAAIFYYDVVYTLWLKRRTSQNTFWGGVCGAAPVIIGWAAVTGSVSAMGWALFAIVFFWQMPHFYALAIKYKDDYARAGIPMLPVVRSAGRVNREILLFTVLTVAASLVAWPLGLGPIYGVTASVVGALFLLEAIRLVGRSRRGEALKPMRLFHWSTTYLTILFIAVAIDALV